MRVRINTCKVLKYSILSIGVNEVSVSLRAAYYGCRMTNCDVINIRNISYQFADNKFSYAPFFVLVNFDNVT